jgi:hypothetical protein
VEMRNRCQGSGAVPANDQRPDGRSSSDAFKPARRRVGLRRGFFGVVTERSAARMKFIAAVVGIDLVKASSITLSPNSNLLPKCYLPLHQTNSRRRLANCR